MRKKRTKSFNTWDVEDAVTYNSDSDVEMGVKQFILLSKSLVFRPLPKTSTGFSAAVNSLREHLYLFEIEMLRWQDKVDQSLLFDHQKKRLAQDLQNAYSTYRVRIKKRAPEIILNALENFSSEFDAYRRSNNAVTLDEGIEIFMENFALDGLEEVVNNAADYELVKANIQSHEFYYDPAAAVDLSAYPENEEEEVSLFFHEQYKTISDIMLTEMKSEYDHIFDELEEQINHVQSIDQIHAITTAAKLYIYTIVAEIYHYDVSIINRAAEFLKNEIDIIARKKIEPLNEEFKKAKEDLFIDYLKGLGNLQKEIEVVEWVVKVKEFAVNTVLKFFDDAKKINAEIKSIQEIVDKSALEKIKSIELNQKIQLERTRSTSCLLEFEHDVTDSDEDLEQKSIESNGMMRLRSVSIPETVMSFITGSRLTLFRRDKVEAIKLRETRSHSLEL